MKRWIWIILIVVIVAGLAACASSSGSSSQPAQNPPANTQSTLAPSGGGTALDGKALVEQRCTTCHGLKRAEGARLDEAGWKQTVSNMVGKGAQLNAEEQAAAVKYLAENFKP